MNPNRKKPLVGCSCGSYSSVGNMKEPLRNNVKVEELDMRQTELQIQSKQQNTTSKHNLTNQLVSHSSVGADSLVFFALDVCVRSSLDFSWRDFSLQALILFSDTEFLSRFLHPAKLFVFNTTDGTDPHSHSVSLFGGSSSSEVM